MLNSLLKQSLRIAHGMALSIKLDIDRAAAELVSSLTPMVAQFQT
jgi:hypothetical protein